MKNTDKVMLNALIQYNHKRILELLILLMNNSIRMQAMLKENVEMVTSINDLIEEVEEMVK